MLGAALALVGLEEDVAGAWVEALVAQAVHAGTAHPSLEVPGDGSGDGSGEVAGEAAGTARRSVSDGEDSAGSVVEGPGVGVAGMVAMARARCTVDATLLVCVQDMVLATGQVLLARRGVAQAQDLGVSARRAWRGEVKASVAAELQVALGVGITEARQLVAVACLPGAVRVPVVGALRRGEVHWALVRRFQSRTSRLEVADAARVAQVLFGTDPALAAVERLDPDGVLTGRPWHHAEFYAALDREVARLKDDDERSAAAARAEARAARRTSMQVHDDGTATLALTGPLPTMVALSGRLEGMARRCRAAGDGRTLAQLRADIAAVLLLMGTVDLPGPHEDDPDAIITPEDVAALQAVIAATPAGQVELVVPWDALLGRAVCPTCQTPVPTGPGQADDHASTGTRTGSTGDHASTGGSGRGGAPPDRRSTSGSAEDADPGARGAGQERPPPRWVAELRGLPAGWVGPHEARQVALTPGTTFYRVLTDPADGRCIERTIARYAPDADMRRQIRAADVYGRGPGCRRPADTCELDHEHEHADGGPTTETNLNAKSRLDHYRKTKKLLRTLMTPRRDLTWTTLLGQVARTRAHDYRQYADAFATLAPPPAGTDPDLDTTDLAARRDLAAQVLYAAIVHRGPGERAEADDDVPGSEDWLHLGDWKSLTHRDEDGTRHHGLPPHHPTPEQILGLTPDPHDHDAPSTDQAPGTTTPDDTHPTSWAQQHHDRPADEPPPF